MSRQDLSLAQVPPGIELGSDRPATRRIAERHRPAREQGGESAERRRRFPDEMIWQAGQAEVGQAELRPLKRTRGVSTEPASYRAEESVGIRRATGFEEDGETGRNLDREFDRDRFIPAISAKEWPAHR
jgi:hypothetical protein